MYQVAQRSLADVLRIAALQTIVEVERESRAADLARVGAAADQLRAVVERAPT